MAKKKRSGFGLLGLIALVVLALLLINYLQQHNILHLK